MWVEFVRSLLCTERFFSGFSLSLNKTFDLICVNLLISAREDLTLKKKVSFVILVKGPTINCLFKVVIKSTATPGHGSNAILSLNVSETLFSGPQIVKARLSTCEEYSTLSSDNTRHRLLKWCLSLHKGMPKPKPRVFSLSHQNCSDFTSRLYPTIINRCEMMVTCYCIME